jgi:hypothetical protein
LLGAHSPKLMPTRCACVDALRHIETADVPAASHWLKAPTCQCYSMRAAVLTCRHAAVLCCAVLCCMLHVQPRGRRWWRFAGSGWKLQAGTHNRNAGESGWQL